MSRFAETLAPTPRVAPRVAPMLALLAALGCGPASDSADRQSGAEAQHDEADGQHSEEVHREGVVELSAAKLAEIEIELATVTPRLLSRQIVTTGEVGFEQDRLAHVSPRISGRVLEVRAALGDDVKAGQTLAVIDSVELGQAKAAYLAARVREDLARENAEREERLFTDRISSEKEMLEARAAHLEARSHRESAEETLRLFGVGPAEVEAMRSGDPGASHLAVRSPIGGRVVEKHVAIGELVTPAENLFTVADLDRVWIWIDVFERDLASVHRGDGVEVHVGSFPDRKFSGELTYLGPQVAADTRTVRARIDVANPDEMLRPGMFATVRLTDPHEGGGEEVLAAPAAAVQRVEGRTVVFVPLEVEGAFEARPIEIGRREGDLVEILSGLAARDLVVTTGAFFLKSELARDELGGEHGH